MDFNPTAEQQMLSDTLRRLFTERFPLEARKALGERAPGYSVEAWGQLAELGVLGALFDLEAGGYGGAPADVATVFEALGRGAASGPFLAVLLSGGILAAVGGEPAGTLLHGIIGGETIVAFAHQEPGSRYELSRVETRATPTSAGWRLAGAKAVVFYAEAADQLIVSARVSGETADEAGLSLFLVPREAPGLAIRGYPSVDGSRSAEVVLHDVEVGADRLLGEAGSAFGIIERTTGLGLLALCADAVGALDVVKDATAEYLRTRVQFGQPIGNFQALQHRMATLLIEIEQARSALANAVAAFQETRPAGLRASAVGGQVHGRAGWRAGRRGSGSTARWYWHDLGVAAVALRQTADHAGSHAGRR